MNKNFWFEFRSFTPRATCSIEGDGGGGDPGSGGGDPAAGVDPNAAAAVADPAAAVTDPNAAAAEPTIDPNDPLAALTADIDKLAAEDAVDPNAPDPQAAQPVPAEFEAALTISPFVRDAATVQQAVRAADEVWKVATGELPARTLIEGIKDANPAQYRAIIEDLIPYIEGVTGTKFGGKAGDPVDPVAQLRAEIEQGKQQEQQQREQAVYQQQVGQASKVALGKVSEMLKGTFAEGNEAYFLAQCASRVNMPEQQMVRELLAGNTKPLEAALKAVRRDEVTRLKAYNENLIKSRRALAGSVPGTKNTPVTTAAPASAKRPDESVTAYATRLWKEGTPTQ